MAESEVTVKMGPERSLDQEAERISKLLFQIADSLEEDKIVEIYRVLNGLMESSIKKDESGVKERLRRFYELVSFKAGISVSLCKQGIRSLHMIKDNPDLGRLVLDPVREKVAEKFPDLAAMGKLDDQTLEIYIKALEGQTEILNHIRLMVVGMYGVGKTCLVRRLRGETIDDVVSTVGIEINVKVCALNEDGTWINQTPDDIKANELDKRAQEAMVKHKTERRNDLPTSRDAAAELAYSRRVQPKASERHPEAPQRVQTHTLTSVIEERNVGTQDNVRKKIDELSKDKGVERFVKNIESGVRSGAKTYSKRRPTVSIWDFAGQSVYYSTHQFFLSSRSIYLLVLDISKPLDTIVNETDEEREQYILLQGAMGKDYTCLDAFKFWVTSIYTYTQYKATKDQQKYKPTIVLIGTHGDCLEGGRKKKERMKESYFKEARKYFVGTPAGKLFYHTTYLVSCTKDEENVFNDLKAKITEIAKKQPYWGKKTPAKWIPLERSIELDKEKKMALMKLNELNVVNEKNECVLKKEEIKLFLETLHFRGQAIYFDAQDLDETIILNPQWLVDIFKLFVTHQPKVPDELCPLWYNYQRTAKLNQNLLHTIIEINDRDAGSENSRFGDKEKELVRYMEHLDVIAKPLKDTGDAVDAVAPDFHIVPCVLKHLTEKDQKDKSEDYKMVRNELNDQKKGKSTPVLCFVFKLGYLPQSVFHRLMATYIRTKRIVRRGEDYLLYNGFGAFKLKGTRTLCIWFADFIIYARVTLHDTEDEFLSTDECINLRKELSNFINKILQDNPNPTSPSDDNVNDAFTMRILCEKQFLKAPLRVLRSKTKPDLKVGLHKVEKLKCTTSISCGCEVSKSDPHVIKCNEALKYWYKEPDYLQPISEWFKEKENHVPNFLQQPVKDDYLIEFSQWLTENEFPKLGKLLEIHDNIVNQIQKSNASNHSRVMELFNKWLKKDERKYQEVKDKLYLLKERQNIDQ